MPASLQIPLSWVKLFLGRQLFVRCKLNDIKYMKNVSSKRNIFFVSNYLKFNSNRIFLTWAYAVGGGGAGVALAPFILTLEAATALDVNDNLLKEADSLYLLNKFEDIYALLAHHKDLPNDEILWRLSRATYERAKAAGTDKNTALRAQLLREAFSYVERALVINKENFAVHKWMAILVDEVAALDGSKSRILKSFVMKDHMEKACKLNPTDGTSWHLLGLWHFNVSNITWYERKAASVLFASPPQSSYQEALESFLHAEQVEPNFYSQNLLMIAKCYEHLKERDEAVRYLKLAQECAQAAAQPTRDDLQAILEAEQLLKRFGKR